MSSKTTNTDKRMTHMIPTISAVDVMSDKPARPPDFPASSNKQAKMFCPEPSARCRPSLWPDPPPHMGAFKLDIWLLDYRPLASTAWRQALRELIDDEEACQSERFHFADDRLRYLATRALVRSTLSHYAPIAPADWHFTRNAHGRPVIAAHHDAASHLRFSVSHTRGLIALAIGEHCELGVDAESLARPPHLDVAGRFFAHDEARALARTPSARQAQRFYEYWTLKEAYVKAHGLGLSMPLDSFSFGDLESAGLQLATSAPLDENSGNWRFWQWQAGAGHLLALCATGPGGADCRPRLYRLTPGGHALAMSLPLLRQSETPGD